jgi:hypothetical protein
MLLDKIPPSVLEPPEYMLSNERLLAIRDLYPKVKERYWETNLLTAWDRFSDTYERAKPDDKIIDAWIGLESIYAPPSGSKDDLVSTICNAMSFYLAEKLEDRPRLFAEAKHSYDHRSTLVHGYRRSGKTESQAGYDRFLAELPDHAALAVGLLRETLLRAMNHTLRGSG